jgi:uncharacterized membrane protein YhaH (DUF805 family)
MKKIIIKKHPHEKLIATLLILNLLDLCITIFAVEGGLGEEMNPIMGYFLNQSPLAFALFKIFVMQHALMMEINKFHKKGTPSKKWMWYFLIAVYGATVLWNTITVSLHYFGIWV